MTFLWFVAIAIGMTGVFALFWWLVELTGGVAGQALSVLAAPGRLLGP